MTESPYVDSRLPCTVRNATFRGAEITPLSQGTTGTNYVSIKHCNGNEAPNTLPQTTKENVTHSAQHSSQLLPCIISLKSSSTPRGITMTFAGG